jgi:hypothetical protein
LEPFTDWASLALYLALGALMEHLGSTSELTQANEIANRKMAAMVFGLDMGPPFSATRGKDRRASHSQKNGYQCPRRRPVDLIVNG